jgi:hypothetical protein
MEGKTLESKSLPDKLIEQLSVSKVSLYMSYNHANIAESCGAARSSWDSLSAQLSPSSGPADEQGGVSCAVPAHCARIAKTTTAIYVFDCPFAHEIVSIAIGTHKKIAMRNLSSIVFLSLASCRNQPRRRRSMPQLFIGQARGENRGERAEPCKRGEGGWGGWPAYCRMSCKSLLSNASSALLSYFMNTCNSRYY